MTINPIRSLDASLDFLDLPDDDYLEMDDTSSLRIPDRLSEPEITAVSELGSTGEFTLADEDTIVRVPAAVRTDGLETEVYGLDLLKPEDEPKGIWRLPLPILAAGALTGGLVLIMAGALLIPRLMHRNEAPRTAPVVIEQPEPEPDPALTAEQVSTQIASLTYQETNVSLAATDVTIAIKDGQVLVTQELASNEDLDVAGLVTLSSQRAAALASELTDQRVTQENEEDGADFSKLTWVVHLKDGDNFLAITENPGKLRTSDETYGILKGAAGYVLAQDILDALGEDAGLSLSAGEAPVDLDGKAISAAATLPHEEEPEPEEETTEGEGEGEGEYYAEETWEEEYYYEEPTYEEPVYEEPVYEEPVYDEGEYDETWGDGGDAYADGGGTDEGEVVW